MRAYPRFFVGKSVFALTSNAVIVCSEKSALLVMRIMRAAAIRDSNRCAPPISMMRRAIHLFAPSAQIFTDRQDIVKNRPRPLLASALVS